MKQALEESLWDQGYLHNIPLRKDQPISADALCHYFDILIDKNETDHECPAWNALFGEFSAENNVSHLDGSGFNEKHDYVENNEKRRFLIQDFITTEANYIKNLDVFTKTIVSPLRQRSKGRKSSIILGAYECHQVFMNIEEIHKMNAGFYSDLEQHSSSSQPCIGMLFSRHLSDFKCYRNFLLGVENARRFHTKEIKNNMAYQTFIGRTMADGGYTVYDYLLLPGQRLGHYKLFLEELIKHTSITDPDFTYLVESLAKTKDTASLHNDYHTNLIRVFQSMLQSIQHCPASLISQQRRLICHIDATKHDLHTHKPICPVTLFIFTDKIMVVKRPLYESNGLDLCGMDLNRGTTTYVARKDDQHSKRMDRKLKFRGWIGLNDAEIYKGVPELPSSFLLVTTNTGGGSSPEADQGLENYFQQEHVHLFSLVSPTLSSSTSPATPLDSQHTALLSKRNDFIACFGKYKMKMKTDDMPLSFYCWKDHYLYANTYDLAYYHLSPKKNDIALVYTSRPLTDIGYILGDNCLSHPKTLILVSPSSDHQYSFLIQSRLAGQNGDDQTGDVFTQLPIGDPLEFKHDLLSNRNMLRTPSPTPSPQSSTKSVRDTLRQMNKRKSISTINKLLSGSVQATGNLVKSSVTPRTSPTHMQQQQQQWRKSASYYYETPNDQRPSNANTFRRSTTTDLTEQVVVTMSYDIKASMTKKHQRTGPSSNQDQQSSRSSNEKDGSIEDRVNSLCVALAQEMDSSMNNRQAHRSMDGVRSPQAESMNHTQSLARKSPQPSTTILDVSGDRLVTSKVQQDHHHPPYTTPTNTTLESLIAEMDQMKSDFNKRLTQMIDDYEQTSSVVHTLTRDLQKKEDEIHGLRVKYDNSVKENDLLYEAFNSEIDHIVMLAAQRDEPLPEGNSPSLEAQWRKKLEMTIKERNQWHQTACQLARELQDVTLYFETNQSDTRNDHSK
ncbi:hypothetical protein [Absidia glauca]|uniref:DH domain-containing protein n=1 Tax=Absidia glauca TaxID=4829 RepID=A0A168SPR8_ABSGL|nr:hypothetical protein [Absidia glauca]